MVLAGFLILLLSRMPPNRTLGLMVSLGIAVSLVATYLVLPVLWSPGRRKGEGLRGARPAPWPVLLFLLLLLFLCIPPCAFSAGPPNAKGKAHGNGRVRVREGERV